MDDAAERFARDIAEAIAAAFASDAGLAACEARARAEGYDLQVSIEATIGLTPVDDALQLPAVLDLSAHDRRLLRSLRIAADEAAEVE